jgi:hypothetical protein
MFMSEISKYYLNIHTHASDIHSTHSQASVQVDTLARDVTAEITGLWHRVPGLPRGAL